MTILVTGGAGYIGSFMVKRLLDRGDTVVVADSLEKGHRENIDTRAVFMQGNLQDRAFLDKIFSSHKIDAVLHFAAYISVAESMDKPEIYFNNNSFVMMKLLDALEKHNVKKIIFSSTAAVYGNPKKIPIEEDHEKFPTNPYGQSKFISEQILSWYEKVYGINFVSLRYFNASGAAIDGSMGEDHKPEIHIIPCAIHAILQNTEFLLYGDDYPTEDGSCVRDYIHVLDLVESHVLALEKLDQSKGGYFYNVGVGKGYSNKEVITMVKKVTGKDLRVVIKQRRKGDPATLIADSSKIKKELKFSPKYSDLETIITSAWEWHKKKSKLNIDESK